MCSWQHEKIEGDMQYDGGSFERKTAFIGFSPANQTSLFSFRTMEPKKTTLGFEGATNSVFAEFLLHLPTEGTL